MPYLPVIDEFACCAHGDCGEVAPDLFVIGDIAEVTGSGDPDLVLRAAKACPAGAICVIDADTGEQVYP